MAPLRLSRSEEFEQVGLSAERSWRRCWSRRMPMEWRGLRWSARRRRGRRGVGDGGGAARRGRARAAGGRVVHPQSLVHGLVKLADGAMLAHIGPRDMRVAISYALHGGESVGLPIAPLNLVSVGALAARAGLGAVWWCLAVGVLTRVGVWCTVSFVMVISLWGVLANIGSGWVAAFCG